MSSFVQRVTHLDEERIFVLEVLWISCSSQALLGSTCLSSVGSNVGTAIRTVMVGILTRVDNIWNPEAGPASVKMEIWTFNLWNKTDCKLLTILYKKIM